MPVNYSVIPVGLSVDKQIPVVWNSYPPSEAYLADLGENNNLAFVYHKGQYFYCAAEKSRWEWREVLDLDIGEKLMATNFTYPLNWIVNDVEYTSKEYNFFKIKNITIENIASFMPAPIPGLTGNGIVNSDYDSNTGVIRITFADDTYQETEDLRGQNGVNGREVELRANATHIQWRYVGNPNWIDLLVLTALTPIMRLENSQTTNVNGVGNALSPYEVEVKNLQVTKTESFSLNNSYDQHTIFINNNDTEVLILVPAGLEENFSAIICQKGTGIVRFIQSGTVINFIEGLGLKLLTQNAVCCIEKDGLTENFQLYGQLKP